MLNLRRIVAMELKIGRRRAELWSRAQLISGIKDIGLGRKQYQQLCSVYIKLRCDQLQRNAFKPTGSKTDFTAVRDTLDHRSSNQVSLIALWLGAGFCVLAVFYRVSAGF